MDKDKKIHSGRKTVGIEADVAEKEEDKVIERKKEQQEERG